LEKGRERKKFSPDGELGTKWKNRKGEKKFKKSLRKAGNGNEQVKNGGKTREGEKWGAWAGGRRVWKNNGGVKEGKRGGAAEKTNR